MRALLATLFALLALSGCISDSNETGMDADETETSPDPATETVSHPDVRIVEAHDLTLGLEPTTYTFEIAPGGRDDLFIKAIGRFADQVVADPDVCVRFERVSEDSYSKGSRGHCPTGSGLELQINAPDLGHQMVFRWEDASPGQYTITVSARPHPNILNVHFVVDNP